MGGLLLTAAVCLGVGLTCAVAEPIRLETEHLRYEISPDGTSAALIDLRDGKDYLSPTREPFASIVRAGERHPASAVSRNGDELRVTFSETDITATISVRESARWLIFELVDISTETHVSAETDIEEVVLLNIRIAPPRGGRQIGAQAGCIQMGDFALGCQTLNLSTESRLQPVRGEAFLLGRCYSRFGLKGARVALFGGPSEGILERIEALELAEDLPHPTIDGAWSRMSSGGLQSYLFIDLTEANADEIIDIARELNFGYILIYARTWCDTLGSYEINTRAYPRGVAGLKAVADKAHAAGLKVGIHCLTGFVAKRDPLATPVPDRRLARDGQLVLAADIDERATSIPTIECPDDWPDDIAFGLERQGFEVRIDDEIISYRGLAKTAPFGLQDCRRGAFGTERASHRKGAWVTHLTQRFGHYLADCDTDLADDIARRYADVINQCGMDMIYFDGAGSNIAFGRQWAWRYVPYIPLRSAELWQREVRVGGSCSGPLFWHLKSFRTCNDFVEIGVKRFFDTDKVTTGRAAQANFIPVDFGWWGLHSWAPHRRATTPDEIEYVCQKTLAFDAFWSLETHLSKIKGCGRWDDIRRTIATYERLRLSDYFPEATKLAVQEDGAEFKLLGSDEDGWRLIPARYGPPHHILTDAHRSWTMDNDLPAQPLRFRLYALPVLEPYDSPAETVLVDPGDLPPDVKPRTRAQCRTRLDPSPEQTPSGESSVEFHAASALATPTGWAEHRFDLARTGERRASPALIEGDPEDASSADRWSRALGVWVHGDGKGEVLNIQLWAANGGYRDHYIDVDFTGWKYCELARPESDRVFEFNAGYSTKHATRHFDYNRIISVFLRYNSIPADSEVRCLVGPVKALRERWLPVRDPSFAVAGANITFPCEVETEQYLEFDGDGPARLFDREGVQLREVAPRGNVPTLAPGPNTITFSAAHGADLSNRVEVIPIRLDEL